MPSEGWLTIIGALIALGLVLKFGGSSHALAGDVSGLITGETNALLMSGTKGNNPSGVK